MRRYWYHCTTDWHGESWISKRQIPKCISENEPTVPRLCVAQTVASCLAAGMMIPNKEIYVYRTQKKLNGIKPKGVWDQSITSERWIIDPTIMVLIQTIPIDVSRQIYSAIELYHKITRKKSNIRLRIAQMARAAEIIGTTKYELRYIDRVKKHFEINNPEEYILSRIDPC